MNFTVSMEFNTMIISAKAQQPNVLNNILFLDFNFILT